VVLHSHVAPSNLVADEKYLELILIFIQSAVIYYFAHQNYLKDILWASDFRIVKNAQLQERSNFSGPKKVSEGAKTFWMPKNSITNGDTFMLDTNCKADYQSLSEI
jgi:hypothetical protein